MIRITLTLICLSAVFTAVGQEFFDGTKNTTATISRTGTTNLGYTQFRNNTTNNATILEHTELSGNLYIRSVAGTTDVGNLIVNDVGGNVGIGTTKPLAKLQVTGGGVAVTGFNTQGGVNGFRNYIQLEDAGHAAILYNPGQASQLMFGFHSNGNMYWGSTTTYSMHLKKTGDLKVYNTLAVGGDLKSGSKMSVNGKISATEVEVTTQNWPDYVFDQDYSLKPLQEVKQFIKENGHLPEVPKAAVVEESGVALGEMNALLLKKIEELTLYIIELEERMKVIENKN